jgi:hypothetical protein
MSDWRKPIKAHAEEVAGQFARPGERALLWYVGEEDLARIRRRMACAACLAPFPAPPEKRNLHIWVAEGLLDSYGPVRTRDQVKALICAGRCPSCNSDVSAEMLKLMDVGKDYNNDPKRFDHYYDQWDREDWELERKRKAQEIPA